MKKLTRIYLFFALILPFLAKGQSLFDKANEYYKQGQYDQAIQTYENLLKTGQHSAEVYYNLANAHYKKNHIAPAIYNYEKALLLAPGNKEIQNNLLFAKNMIIDDIKEVPQMGFGVWLQNFTSVYHYDTWGKIGVAFSILFVLFFAIYFWIKKTIYKRLFFGLSLGCILFSAFSVLIAFFEQKQYEAYNPAIVFAEETPLTGEPQKTAAPIMMLHEGTKVLISESSGMYYKIALVNGTEGWIAKQAVKTLR